MCNGAAGEPIKAPTLQQDQAATLISELSCGYILLRIRLSDGQSRGLLRPKPVEGTGGSRIQGQQRAIVPSTTDPSQSRGHA